jgi:hypothetical protein
MSLLFSPFVKTEASFFQAGSPVNSTYLRFF